MRPQLLIFDLDGTLIDSRQDLVACVNASLGHCGLSPLPANQVAGFIGDGAAVLVDRSITAASGSVHLLHDRALSFFLSYYREHLLDHTHLYPGVLATLTAMQALPKPPLMAVLTNKPVNPSRILCDALGLSPFFFANFGGNSFATKKPHPEGLQTIWREAEAACSSTIPAAEVIMIGDSEVDVRTARNAGVLAWGCTWGFATAKMLAERPDALAETPADWLSLLAQQNDITHPQNAGVATPGN